mmetsp:Transcript_14714/g.35714  ORF Transcript_14714/g.35714 Transcript_14714/m.35714 type:complete len:155 (+) Transcript_14714:46-510(+)
MANKLLKAFNLDNQKTFRPKKKHVVGTKRYELHKYAQSTLGAGNLREAVTLPRGEDANEWLAVNSACRCGSCHAARAVAMSCTAYNSSLAPSSPPSHMRSRGLLQRDLPALWHDLRVLHGGLVPGHVRRSKVRVHVGRRGEREETHFCVCARVH